MVLFAGEEVDDSVDVELDVGGVLLFVESFVFDVFGEGGDLELGGDIDPCLTLVIPPFVFHIIHDLYRQAVGDLHHINIKYTIVTLPLVAKLTVQHPVPHIPMHRNSFSEGFHSSREEAEESQEG